MSNRFSLCGINARAFCVSLLAAFVFLQPAMGCRGARSEPQTVEKRLARFESQADELRKLLKIPGMSAVILKDQKVIWAKGFGYADVEKQVPATPDTLYHIASLTKTFAATLLMQLVEQGKLDLNEPMSHYSTDFKDDSVKIKHLMSHTSEGTPGDRYQYNGNRYDYLTAVIEKKYGISFRELLVRTFFEPLGMSESVPSHDIIDNAKWAETLGKDRIERYRTNLTKFAKPFTLYGDEIVPAPYPPKDLGAAAGLLSTVTDLAKYDAAIDAHTFMKQQTQDIAWTPFVSNSGQPLPHGLGWFAENYRGLKLIWHYGHWGTGFSATYLKVPDKHLTMILLANTEALSDAFYQTGGIETNPFACTFLRLFVFEAAGDPRWTTNSAEFYKELTNLKKQAGGYDYDCERVTHAAMTKWLENRRKSARTAVKISSTVLTELPGAYKWNEERTFHITREDDRLFIDMPRGGGKSEMFAESESKFFLKWSNVQISFVRNEKGQIVELSVDAYGNKAVAKRIN